MTELSKTTIIPALPDDRRWIFNPQGDPQHPWFTSEAILAWQVNEHRGFLPWAEPVTLCSDPPSHRVAYRRGGCILCDEGNVYDTLDEIAKIYLEGIRSAA